VSLDPTVAFGEGFGNAISAMTFNDPIYVDTMGANQASGLSIAVNVPPTGDDRGIYSEDSSQYLLWSLYENRDVTSSSGLFDRIHHILKTFHKTQAAMTSLHSFAAWYNHAFGGNAESLRTLWTGPGVDTPFDALCKGLCIGSGDTADLYDSDNDLGKHYGTTSTASRRAYPQGSGVYHSADFWQLYRPVGFGSNAPSGHDRTDDGNYQYARNRWGYRRWYRWTATGARGTITLSALGGSLSCFTDYLDLLVYRAGEILASDVASTGGTAGCPRVTVDTEAGSDYTIVVHGVQENVPSWTLTIGP
jgi:hypothetical protein